MDICPINGFLELLWVEVPEVLMDLFEIRYVISRIFKIYRRESGRDWKWFLPNLRGFYRWWWDVTEIELFKFPTLEEFNSSLIDQCVETWGRW